MSRRGQLRLLLVVLVAALLVGAWQSGLLHWLTEPQRLAEEIAGLGATGMVAFILTYGLLQPFGVPGTVFVVAAPLIWPWPVAFGLNMVGTMLASLIGFGFARVVAREWVAARIPARFRKYDALLEERALEILGERGVKLPADALELLFGQGECEVITPRPVEADEVPPPRAEPAADDDSGERRRRRGGRVHGSTGKPARAVPSA